MKRSRDKSGPPVDQLGTQAAFDDLSNCLRSVLDLILHIGRWPCKMLILWRCFIFIFYSIGMFNCAPTHHWQIPLQSVRCNFSGAGRNNRRLRSWEEVAFVRKKINRPFIPPWIVSWHIIVPQGTGPLISGSHFYYRSVDALLAIEGFIGPLSLLVWQQSLPFASRIVTPSSVKALRKNSLFMRDLMDLGSL